MIKNFKNRSLKKLAFENNKGYLPASQLRKIMFVLQSLEAAEFVQDLNLPGFNLHQLKGSLKSHWAITITGNYRITFRFEKGNVYDVDYIDYH